MGSDYQNVVLEKIFNRSSEYGDAFRVELHDFMVGVYDMETCRIL